MYLEKDNILIEELIDDITIGGITTRHDYDTPYMFCKIIDLSDEARENLGIVHKEDFILVIKRYAKEEFIDNTFFVYRGTIYLLHGSTLFFYLICDFT